MALTICILTRDAEGKIERALRSVAALGAEVIVGDTGSKDGTVPAAQALGAKVRVLAWQDDFAAAQNDVLDEATGDWVLWLNPDEELSPQAREQLPPLLARHDVLAYALRVQEVLQADQPDTAMESLHLRLFRRHPEARYVGRLHPHFIVPLEQLAAKEHLQICPADLIIRHHAYLSVLTEDKVRWATRLLELELRDRPGQLHYRIEYGRNLLRLNDPQGHAVLAEAADQIAAAADAPVPPTPNVASLLEYLLTVSAAQSRSRLAPAQARELAFRWFPQSPPLLWAVAQRAFQAGDHRDAAQLLESLVHLGRTGTYDRRSAFDPSLMAEPALLNLARSYVRLGQLDRAEALFREVLANPAYRSQAQEGCDLVNNLRRRPTDLPKPPP
jgi:hypothetical protein